MSEQRIRTITCRELHELSLKQPINLIDVRTPEEFQEVRAVGARCIPMASRELFDMLQAGSVSDQPIYFICEVGGRSGRVCAAFMAAGQMNVFNVEGGTQAWIEAKLPTESGQQSKEHPAASNCDARLLSHRRRESAVELPPANCVKEDSMNVP